jgi:hypothetical protein
MLVDETPNNVTLQQRSTFALIVVFSKGFARRSTMAAQLLAIAPAPGRAK